MKKVKTIKGLLGKLKQVTDIDRDHIKGHDKLTDEQKNLLSFLFGEVQNFISEIESINEKA